MALASLAYTESEAPSAIIIASSGVSDQIAAPLICASLLPMEVVPSTVTVNFFSWQTISKTFSDLTSLRVSVPSALLRTAVPPPTSLVPSLRLKKKFPVLSVRDSYFLTFPSFLPEKNVI